MDELQTTCKFVSKKVKKVCWQKVANGVAQKFCTGSWDDGFNNEIAIWRIDSLLDAEEYNFVKCSSFSSRSDVEDLQFLTTDKLIYSSALGDLFVLNYNSIDAELNEIASWKSLHSGACNSFSTCGSDVVTVGEDGRLKTLNLNQKDVFDVTNQGASAPFYAVSYYGFQEVVAGNSVGQLQLWDLRDKRVEALIRTLIPGVSNSGSVTSLRCHPSQQHLVIAGYQSGLVVFWDLRKFDFPSAAIRIHNGPVWDIQFHEFYPTNIFTASNDGFLVHWDASAVQLAATVLNESWFLSDSLQSKLKLNNILPDNVFPVNSVDVHHDRLLTCTDNEAIFLFNNMNFC